LTNPKHVEVGTEDNGRTTQASRVITHKDAYGGSCPGKAGAFAGVTAADTALKIAIKDLFAQNGGWTAAGGWRDKIAQGVGFQDDMPVVATGYVQQRPDGEKKKYPAKEQPPFLSPSDGEGGRPLYPSDPNFLANMEPYKQAKAKPGDPDVYMSAGKAKTKKAPAVPGNVITLDLSSPMTVNVVPSKITIRVVATPNTSAAGWCINSAWPV
jgi:hypothetical protein